MKRLWITFGATLICLTMSSQASACGFYGFDEYHRVKGFSWAPHKPKATTTDPAKSKAVGGVDAQTTPADARPRPTFSRLARIGSDRKKIADTAKKPQDATKKVARATPKSGE